MLDKVKREVFFVARLLVVLYLSTLLLISYENVNYIAVGILSVYFLINVYVYFFSKPRILQLISPFLDIILVPAFVFFSKILYSIYALGVLISVYAWRKPVLAGIILLETYGLAFFYFSGHYLLMISHFILFLALFFTSYNFEYATVVGKERKRILKLKKNYHKLLKEFSNFEREKRMFSNLRKILKLLRESKEPKDYFEGLKREFNVKRISVIPVNEVEGEEVFDYDKGTLSVFVKLDRGYAKVVYELDPPFRLRDPVLIQALVEGAKLLSLYVEGFEESAEGKQVLVVG
ncbi:hypothetical protein [Aquifex aeolicus]|uniref:Uncharacterized protein aq_1842 n=1 Tax=Aquifex aeolicus (strain VF5) TaxID=224324 RepID=Y1842_AQUAE|nr:hypothetical protein [Aquifex aeolicus]O67696.1 RecName: Full=Uncharacterized protein aq_1842 [Aquifex aeolicus VF5]AAC07660.1 putative protein [Aquifex aeolicus VF5]